MYKNKAESVIVVQARSTDQFEIQLMKIINTFGLDRIKIIGSGCQQIRQAINIYAIVVVIEKESSSKKIST